MVQAVDLQVVLVETAERPGIQAGILTRNGLRTAIKVDRALVLTQQIMVAQALMEAQHRSQLLAVVAVVVALIHLVNRRRLLLAERQQRSKEAQAVRQFI
jgi:hypothetical protein